MRCVVCGARDAEHYANTWEKVRKRYPCCLGCVDRFDPDVHWIPARFPDVPPQAELFRLLTLFGKKLGGGDSPRVVIREALLAGVPPVELRRFVLTTAGNVAHAENANDMAEALGFMARTAVHVKRDTRGKRDFQDALDDLAAWERATSG